MKKLLVLDIVGLSAKHLNQFQPPNILKIFEKGCQTVMKTSFPAVTCSVQASLTSGFNPSEHGIISNGFYNFDSKEVSFWEQSSNLVAKPRIWDLIKKSNPRFKIAVLFWQNSLYIDSDIVLTPKPIHLDSGMVMWCYSKPVNYYEDLVKKIGNFDLSSYWGPFTSIKSSKWIIEATKQTIENHYPDLCLVYLPHLDYAAQKYGPESKEFEKAVIELDYEIGNLLTFLKSTQVNEYEILVLSEYSFSNVNNSISPNILLKNNGLLSTRNISGKEYIDFEHSKAFAMVDHQIAHVFTNEGYEKKVTKIFEGCNGISEILDNESKKILNIDHPKSGNLILVAENDFWFNYYWWNDENAAPEFIFNVDIHRKPGYDPLELFLEPQSKKISRDISLIKGSHGKIPSSIEDSPIFGMSMKAKKSFDIVDINQIAPTILKFFDVDSNLPGESII